MDFLAELLIDVQLLLALAAIPLYILSKRTSRSAHGRHETFLSIAVFIFGAAALASIIALYGAGTTDHEAYLLVLLPPVLTSILSALVFWRSVQAAAISRRRQRSPSRAR